MKGKKKLTICIPTYNRKIYLTNQLLFLYKQVSKNNDILDFVEFIVSDNASNDGTHEILKELQEKYKFFKYHINTSNLGLIGNVNLLLNLSQTEYVWFISDDDKIRDGVIEEILKIINTNQPSFIFINYILNKNKAYRGTTGYRTDSRKAALEIFREQYGSLVFITACVYKRVHLLEIKNFQMSTWLSAPLYFSFFSLSKGSAYITRQTWITFTPNNASYAGLKRILKLKFEEYLTILEYLPQMEYQEKEVSKTIKIFFEKQSHAHFLYNFVSFSNSLRLYKYYNFKTLIKLPFNILSYLFK